MIISSSLFVALCMFLCDPMCEREGDGSRYVTLRHNPLSEHMIDRLACRIKISEGLSDHGMTVIRYRRKIDSIGKTTVVQSWRGF